MPRDVTLEVIACIQPGKRIYDESFQITKWYLCVNLEYTTSSVQTSSTSLSSITSSNITGTILSTSTTSTAEVCVKVEAMNPQIGVIDDIFIYPSSLDVYTDDLVPGQNGVDFPETELLPNITIVFSRVGSVFSVQVPPESQSNVNQIFVEFFNPQGQLINSITSPVNSPQLPDNLEVDNVLEIVIHLIATSDGLSPKNVTIDVIGCFFEGN
jgi:hypothetical protein